MAHLIKAHVRMAAALREALADRDAQRGDIPGWVLITIMTAGLVATIWGFADDKLTELFDQAVSNVTPGGN